jgi:predicted RNA methylase
MELKLKNILIRKIKIFWDKLHGFDFHSTIKSEDLNLNPDVFYNSSPSASYQLLKLFNSQKFTKKDSIIDIGCGKGSILRILLKYPFKNIGGIEISETIFNICLMNFNKIKDNRVTIFYNDARFFNDYDNYNYYYAYNPCSKKIFDEIIKNIVLNATNNKTFIYSNAKWDSVLKKYGFIFDKKYFDEWGNPINIYSLIKNV